MVEICRKLRPESLEDLSALNALYRPGPLDGGMVDDYIDRRHGRKKVQYIIPQMKEVLENTYGILVYQEQIMQLAQKLAGYSLGEADLMRRAMGKKKKEEMAQHEEKFVRGAVERHIAEEKARKIFSLMAQFADYGFNRSHSFAYAYLAYQTAYLKAHYPPHFYAAVLSNEIENSDKVARYIAEMKSLGIELFPPDVNTSHEGFTPVGGAVRFGLAAIKGLGSSAVQFIIRAREDGGPFKSLFDLTERVDQRAVNKRVLESLIKSGACETFSPHRASLFAALDRAIEHGGRTQRDRASGQGGLFVQAATATTAFDEPPLPAVKAWSRKEMLAFEKETLGFYASGHPLEDYTLRGLVNADSSNLAQHAHSESVAMGGIVTDLAIRVTKKGDRFALFRLEDQYGAVKIICWPEQFNRYRGLLEDNHAVLVKGRLELSDDGVATLVTQEVQALEGARAKAAKLMLLKLPEASITNDRLCALGELLESAHGETPVSFEIVTRDGLLTRVRPKQFLRVKLSPSLTDAITRLGQDWEIDLVLSD
jgi:DNA polymerase-3 subunit alpha